MKAQLTEGPTLTTGSISNPLSDVEIEVSGNGVIIRKPGPMGTAWQTYRPFPLVEEATFEVVR